MESFKGAHVAFYTFLLYVNDMKPAVSNSDLILYADDNCVLFINENVNSIKKRLNADFVGQIIYTFGHYKTKYNLFKKENKPYPILNISRKEIKIKQYS